jgi:glycerol-3-phosphate dehydrogenase
MVRFAVRCEYARSVEDVLARRSRVLFLDARLAASIAERTAAILAEELGGDFDAGKSLRSFRELADRYGRLPPQPAQ